LARQMIRSPAEASAPSAIRIGAAVVDEAEVDQVVADPGGSSRQRAQSAAISRTLRPVR
jgi:hypothetical protein